MAHSICRQMDFKHLILILGQMLTIEFWEISWRIMFRYYKFLFIIKFKIKHKYYIIFLFNLYDNYVYIWVVTSHLRLWVYKNFSKIFFNVPTSFCSWLKCSYKSRLKQQNFSSLKDRNFAFTWNDHKHFFRFFIKRCSFLVLPHSGV